MSPEFCQQNERLPLNDDMGVLDRLKKSYVYKTEDQKPNKVTLSNLEELVLPFT